MPALNTSYTAFVRHKLVNDRAAPPERWLKITCSVWNPHDAPHGIHKDRIYVLSHHPWTSMNGTFRIQMTVIFSVCCCHPLRSLDGTGFQALYPSPCICNYRFVETFFCIVGYLFISAKKSYIARNACRNCNSLLVCRINNGRTKVSGALTSAL